MSSKTCTHGLQIISHPIQFAGKIVQTFRRQLSCSIRFCHVSSVWLSCFEQTAKSVLCVCCVSFVAFLFKVWEGKQEVKKGWRSGRNQRSKTRGSKPGSATKDREGRNEVKD